MSKIIWTNHAMKRVNDRRISKNLIIEAINNPDKTIEIKSEAFEFQKIINNQTVAAVVKQNDRGEKVIVSCWVNPPNAGTLDFKRNERYKKMQNASFLKKLWFTLLNQLGF